MKKLIFILSLALLNQAYAADAASAVLTARGTSSQGLSDPNSSYSFQYGTQDHSASYTDYDIRFDGETLTTIQVVDDIGQLVDLGAISCKDIKNSYQQSGTYPGPGHGGYPFAEDRVQNPIFWFEYSAAMELLQNGTSTASLKVVASHCYLVHKLNNARRVLAVFHVLNLDPDKSLSIDEIEVIQRQVLTPAK